MIKWKNAGNGKVLIQRQEDENKQLNNESRRITDEAKEIWWANQCSELESLDRQGRSDLIYAKVNELTKSKISTSKSSSLKDKNGNLLTKPEEIKLRWKEYIEELYAKQEKATQIKIKNEVDVCEDNKGPYLLESEILQTIKEMKDGKAAGWDKITAELIKNSGTITTKELAQICQKIYNEEVWPKDFLKTVMIPIEEKIGATDWADFRTISFICHVSKIVLGILKKRITSKADEYLGED